mgnify:CR=1 FL=1
MTHTVKKTDRNRYGGERKKGGRQHVPHNKHEQQREAGWSLIRMAILPKVDEEGV